MLYLIGPDGLINLSFENFQKMVWMTIHVVPFHAACFGKFAYLRFTLYADNIRFSHEQNLKRSQILSVIQYGLCQKHLSKVTWHP